MQIKAKDFKNRKDLNNYISAKFGHNIQANREAKHTITGTKEELRALSLSDTSNIWGITCLFSDETPERFKKKEKMSFRQKQKQAQKDIQPEIEKQKADDFMRDYLELCQQHGRKLIAIPKLGVQYQVQKLSDVEIEKINESRVKLTQK